jgi:probable rRNA maturation factor
VNLSLNRSDDTDPSWLDGEVTESIRRVCNALGPAAAVNVVVVDDAYIREINREFRNVDKPTDVISFSYLDNGEQATEADDDVAGEVYISYQMIEKEAKELGVEPAKLFLRVGVHGLLHVIGFDHDTDEDETRMEREEKSILSELLAPREIEALF